jgi:hypothetical protein
MSTKQRNTVKFNKKNDGQEISIDFTYVCERSISSTDRIRVELWVRQQGTLLLHAWKMQFPEMMNGGGGE